MTTYSGQIPKTEFSMLTGGAANSEMSFVTLVTVHPPRCCSNTTQGLLCVMSFVLTGLVAGIFLLQLIIVS